MQKYLIFDYETRSEANLKKVGAFEYSIHPSTRILCAAWRLGTREEIKRQKTKSWAPALHGKEIPHELAQALIDPKVYKGAHNALFEQLITKNVLFRNTVYRHHIPEWFCTAALSRFNGGPGKLEHACFAFNLPVQKDTQGHRLMLKLSKPRKPTKKDPRLWHNKKSDLLRVIKYCEIDVDAEVEIFLALPPLPRAEQKVWELDQKINLRGMPVDRELVLAALELIKTETENLNKEFDDLTGLGSANRRDALLKWLRARGLPLVNMQKKPLQDILKTDIDPVLRRVIEIRLSVSKVSTKKYLAYEMRSRHDGRVRDTLVYHTAVPTARWGGGGLQPQNMPRPTLKSEEIQFAIDLIKERKLELLRLLLGDPMEVMSSCLRSAIAAHRGMMLFNADYAAIEVRVLFWMAGHHKGCQWYREGAKLYEIMAAQIYRIDVDSVCKEERQVGKAAILGCGYGMGADRFKDSCEEKGIKISRKLALKAVDAYRTVHAPIPRMWKNLERAAVDAVKNPGKRYTINMTTWWVEGRFLRCRLPSGRVMSYVDPEVRSVKKIWGRSNSLTYMGIHPKTKKWARESTWGGKLAENVVQAVARDLLVGSHFRLEAAGYPVVLHVHDENLSETPEDFGGEKEYEKIMAELPPWAAGCPVAAEGEKTRRYNK